MSNLIMSLDEIRKFMLEKYKKLRDDLTDLEQEEGMTSVVFDKKRSEIWSKSGLAIYGREHVVLNSFDKFVLNQDFEVVDVERCCLGSFVFAPDGCRIKLKYNQYSGFITTIKKKKANSLTPGQKIHVTGKVKIELFCMRGGMLIPPEETKLTWKERFENTLSFEVI